MGVPTPQYSASSDGRVMLWRGHEPAAYVDAAAARAVLGVLYAPQGRLTLATGVPVMTTTQSAKTTLYYTPYVGNQTPVYDGTNMVPMVFSELSVATTDTTYNPSAIGASKVNDWFVWNDGGTIRLSHGPDWTDDTTRSAGTALVMVNGILLNNASITNGPAASRGTYVGTTRSNASSQLDWMLGGAASGGTAGFLGVWNAYNRVSTVVLVQDNGVSYTYGSTTIRQMRASAGMKASFVVGLSEEPFEATNTTLMVPAASTGQSVCYVGYDSITAASGSSGFNGAPSFALGPVASYAAVPTIGLHYVAGLESSPFGTTTFFPSGSCSLTLRTRA